MILKFYTLCALSFAGNVASQVYLEGENPQVKLSEKAILSGSVDKSREGRLFSSFLGIPYATVPERFAEPQLITTPTWDGVKSATKEGAWCPQINRVNHVMHFNGKEDCLFVNVYVPLDSGKEKSKDKLYPVMVWIHGGGLVEGLGTEANPEFFMDEDVILVSLNYRLGVFGFLSTGDEVIPGNMGFKDQSTALRWIQGNIKSFGGDPNQVTIFGESAGGASVHHQVMSPMSKGLFQRAIVQSGSTFSIWGHQPKPKPVAAKLAAYLCPTANPSGMSSNEIKTCLQGIDTEKLSRALYEFYEIWPQNILALTFSPVSEPEVTPTSKHTPFMTQSPWSRILEKDQKPLSDVPLMIGNTEDEGYHLYASYIVRNQTLQDELNEKWNEVAPNSLLFEKHLTCKKDLDAVSDELRKFYFGTKPITTESEQNLSNIFSDMICAHAIHRLAMETAKRSDLPVYLYEYAYDHPYSVMAVILGVTGANPKKVAHADELPMLFNTSWLYHGSSEMRPNTPDEYFSKNFVKLWASFAINGTPSHVWGSNVKWNPVSKEEANGAEPLKYYKIQTDPEIIIDPLPERAKLWDKLWTDYFMPAQKKYLMAKDENAELCT